GCGAPVPPIATSKSFSFGRSRVGSVSASADRGSRATPSPSPRTARRPIRTKPQGSLASTTPPAVLDTESPSGGELIADRQPSDALAGGRENSVAQRRGKGWQSRLADPARRHVDPVGHNPDMGDRRRFVDAHDLKPVEVILLHPPVFEADL